MHGVVELELIHGSDGHGWTWSLCGGWLRLKLLRGGWRERERGLGACSPRCEALHLQQLVLEQPREGDWPWKLLHGLRITMKSWSLLLHFRWAWKHCDDRGARHRHPTMVLHVDLLLILPLLSSLLISFLCCFSSCVRGNEWARWLVCVIEW